jgi:hypothetical protein
VATAKKQEEGQRAQENDSLLLEREDDALNSQSRC